MPFLLLWLPNLILTNQSLSLRVVDLRVLVGASPKDSHEGLLKTLIPFTVNKLKLRHLRSYINRLLKLKDLHPKSNLSIQLVLIGVYGLEMLLSDPSICPLQHYAQ